MLTGKYQNSIPPGARFSDYLTKGAERQKRMAQRFVNPRSIEATARFTSIADEIGVTVTALSLAWSRQHDFVASTIFGVTGMAQLEECLAATDLILSDETLRQIDAIDFDIPNPMTEDGLRRL
jgi:aryl-alcohol dehydrogenase-like predicted oxidoreductase